MTRDEMLSVYCVLFSRAEIEHGASTRLGDDPLDLAVQRKFQEKLKLIPANVGNKVPA